MRLTDHSPLEVISTFLLSLISPSNWKYSCVPFFMKISITLFIILRSSIKLKLKDGPANESMVLLHMQPHKAQ